MQIEKTPYERLLEWAHSHGISRDELHFAREGCEKEMLWLSGQSRTRSLTVQDVMRYALYLHRNKLKWTIHGLLQNAQMAAQYNNLRVIG